MISVSQLQVAQLAKIVGSVGRPNLGSWSPLVSPVYPSEPSSPGDPHPWCRPVQCQPPDGAPCNTRRFERVTYGCVSPSPQFYDDLKQYSVF